MSVASDTSGRSRPFSNLCALFCATTIGILLTIAPGMAQEEFDIPVFPTEPSPLLLVETPIDAGRAADRKKNLWLYALLDACARFRLDHCTSFRTVPVEIMERHRSLVRTGKENQETDYSALIGELAVTHAFRNKFEIDYRKNTLVLDLAVIDLANRSPVIDINAAIPLSDAGRLIDSCFFAATRALAGNRLSPEEVRFFITPALCVQSKANTKLGEIVYHESYSGARKQRQTLIEYARILETEKKALFCEWRYAEAALREGYFDEALSGFNELYAVLPEKTGCGMAIARVSLGKKDGQTAKYRLNSIVATHRPPPPSAYRLLGDAYLLGRDTATALDYYRKERDQYGSTVSLQTTIAAMSFAMNALTDAEKEYDSLIALDATNHRARYYLAYSKLRLGKENEATVLLAEAQKYDKGVAFLWEPIGDAYAALGKGDLAIDAYRNALALDPRSPRLMLKLSDSYGRAGNDSLAADYLMRHFFLDRKKNIESASKAGHLFLKKNAFSRAEQAFKAYLDGGAAGDEATLAYARIMYNRENWKKVIALLEARGRSAGAGEEVLLMLARAWYETGNFRAAKPVLASLHGMNPKNLDVMRLSAVVAEKTQDLSGATALYEKALMFPELDSAADIALHVGSLYEKQKLLPRAIERYEMNVARYPGDSRSYERLIALYHDKNDKPKLRRILEKAILNVTVPPTTNLLLAQTYRSMGDYGKSVEMYQTYLARESADAEAWRDLGAIYYKEQRYGNAIDPLKRAAGRLKRDFDCQFMLGDCYLKQDDYQAAVVPLERALAARPEDTGTMERLATCYRRLERTDRLYRLLKHWVSRDKKRADIRIELGSLHLDRNKTREAVEVLDEALRLDPSNQKAKQLRNRAEKIEQERAGEKTWNKKKPNEK